MDRNVVASTLVSLQKVYKDSNLTAVTNLHRYMVVMESIVVRQWRIHTQQSPQPISAEDALWVPLKTPAQLLTNVATYIYMRVDTYALWDVTLSESDHGPIVGIHRQGDRNIHSLLHLIALPETMSDRRLEKITKAYATHIMDLKDVTETIQTVMANKRQLGNRLRG